MTTLSALPPSSKADEARSQAAASLATVGVTDVQTWAVSAPTNG